MPKWHENLFHLNSWIFAHVQVKVLLMHLEGKNLLDQQWWVKSLFVFRSENKKKSSRSVNSSNNNVFDPTRNQLNDGVIFMLRLRSMFDMTLNPRINSKKTGAVSKSISQTNAREKERREKMALSSVNCSYLYHFNFSLIIRWKKRFKSANENSEGWEEDVS